MIDVRNLSKHYGQHRAVSQISFRAKKGEILGFLGPNGAGKTTTMRMLTCYLPPTAGSARVAGYDVMEQSLEVRRRIGYLPENVPLYGDLRVTGYLDFVARLKGMPRKTRSGRIGQVMQECGISQVRHRQVGQLSRGYRQRVGLAQALVNNPEVLILDEPTVGLDPRQIIEIRELIRNLAGERTIILSTHILPEVSLLCDRVIIIDRGKLVAVDRPENLKSRLSHATVIDLVARGDVSAIAGCLRKLPGVRSVERGGSVSADTHRLRVESRAGEDVRESVSRALVDGGFGLLSLETADMSLEDIFVKLVTREEPE
ncbi:MAG: ATP-binding cassette domain-containing protein [Candidatus Krumholzibacteriia bacterium]